MKISERYNELISESERYRKEADFQEELSDRTHMRSIALGLKERASSLANAAAPFMEMDESDLMEWLKTSAPDE